jgi:hypothetical protein
MTDELGNRKLYRPRGRDPIEDLCLLADCIAASSADLFAMDDGVVWIVGGKRLTVNPNVLREICLMSVVTKHPRETAAGWNVEFRAHDPDQTTLHALVMAKTRSEGSLKARLPVVPRTLSPHHEREARARIGRGELAANVARDLGTDLATIKQLAG